MPSVNAHPCPNTRAICRRSLGTLSLQFPPLFSTLSLTPKETSDLKQRLRADTRSLRALKCGRSRRIVPVLKAAVRRPAPRCSRLGWSATRARRPIRAKSVPCGPFRALISSSRRAEPSLAPIVEQRSAANRSHLKPLSSRRTALRILFARCDRLCALTNIQSLVG